MTRALLLVAALAASPVGALTCAPPDPVTSFHRADAAPERHRALVGTLSFDDAALPPPANEAPPSLPDVPARLDGAAILPNGGSPGSFGVTIRPTCAGSWCGWIPSGESWLLFVREEREALVVEVGPCGGWAFMDPTQAQLDAVTACLRGEACGP